MHSSSTAAIKVTTKYKKQFQMLKITEKKKQVRQFIGA